VRSVKVGIDPYNTPHCLKLITHLYITHFYITHFYRQPFMYTIVAIEITIVHVHQIQI